MIISEINEIKKRIRKTGCDSLRICGCYVAGDDKRKLTYINDYLGNLPEEEQHKYVELLRKSLSGSLGKSLLNLEFTKEAEQDGGAALSLLALRDSCFKSEAVLDSFYDYIIEHYGYVGNYLILMMYDSYDVPVKTADNIKLDESSEVYTYILCAICPVNLSKAGLSYHEDTNLIQTRYRDWVVEAPVTGFLFPAFNDRSADIHSLLYYTKTTKEMHSEFITEGLGCEEKLPADMEKTIFKNIVEEALSYQPETNLVEAIREINDNVTQLIDNNSSDEPVMLDKAQVKNLLARSGIKNEQLEMLDKRYDEELGADFELAADSIAEQKTFEIKNNDVSIKMKSENASRIEIKMIDGHKCLVIPVDDDIEVNGIMSRIRRELSHAEEMSEEQ